jgi:probable F420-dependent oxidoreductase
MSVRIGVSPGLVTALSPQDYWRWVDLCEESGIDSIWHSDQLLGGTPEPLAMLAALAGRTRRLRFGTNALVVPFRDPLLVAKQLATIDYLSEGRVFPVFGIGRAADPFWSATFTDPGERGRRGNEALALIRQLLEHDEVEFAGRHFRYHGPGVTPRPLRAIPLWTGGHSDAAVRRTAALGDGWLGGLLDAGKAGETRLRIEAALIVTGRTIEPDHYGVTLPLRIGAANDPAVIAARESLNARLSDADRVEGPHAFAVGPPDEVIATLRVHVAAGMAKFVVLPVADGVAELIEQTRLLVRDILPAVED